MIRFDHPLGHRAVVLVDIFAQDSIKNGLLPTSASAADVAELVATLERHPELNVTVDLETQTITCGNYAFKFSMPASWREQLLNGWDEIDLTRSNQVRELTFSDMNGKDSRSLRGSLQ